MILRLLAVFIALLIYVILQINLIENKQALAAYSSLLVIYLYAEVKNLRTHEPHLIWLNPVVLASILTFASPFGITNLLFYMPAAMLAPIGFEPIATVWMNQLMLLVILGACAMWVGYSSLMGRSIGRLLKQSRLLRKWISTSTRMNKFVLFVLFAISLIAKLLAIELGVYGYSSSYDQIIAAASYTQYLGIAQLLGKLALLGVAIQCFSTLRPILSDRIFLWLMIVYEIVFGLLSGMKSAVVMPFIIVGIVYYSQRNRFPAWLIPSVLVGLMAAYAIIEPYRAAHKTNAESAAVSLDSIVTVMSNASSNVSDSTESAFTGISILSRSNLTYIASLGIEYKANKELPEDSPAFLRKIILAPLYAFIPRFLWSSKPLETDGLWYTHEVIGHDVESSTAMSPFTYLNFAGGPLAVIIGFFIVGVFQRGFFDGLRYYGGGGLIIIFGLLEYILIYQ